MKDTTRENTPGMTTLCCTSVPAPPVEELNESHFFDSVKLDQRLDSLLLDLQAGTEQVKSIWQKWHDPDEDGPMGLLDKPQTAPPPASPSEKMFENVAENSKAVHSQDLNDDIVELISNQMKLAPFMETHNPPVEPI